jgi:hypothetical protein
LFSRLPIGLVHHLSLYPAILLWIALRLGLNSIEYFRLLRRLSLRHIRSIVFDQMLPKIANYWSRETVERMMREQGLVDVKLAWVNEMSWSAIGTKPTTAARPVGDDRRCAAAAPLPGNRRAAVARRRHAGHALRRSSLSDLAERHSAFRGTADDDGCPRSAGALRDHRQSLRRQPRLSAYPGIFEIP